MLSFRQKYLVTAIFAGVLLVVTDRGTASEESRNEARSPQKTYQGELIDLSLRDADLVETLRSFAELGGFNLVIQPGVEGKVTVELEEVPWDQAFEVILEMYDLGIEISGGETVVKSGSAGGE